MIYHSWECVVGPIIKWRCSKKGTRAPCRHYSAKKQGRVCKGCGVTVRQSQYLEVGYYFIKLRKAAKAEKCYSWRLALDHFVWESNRSKIDRILS